MTSSQSAIDALFTSAASEKRSGYVIRSVDVKRVYTMGDSETHALRGVTLDIERGEYMSIMGPSGSGKSTYFNMIGGLDKPTSGKVYIDQVDIAQLNPQELARLRKPWGSVPAACPASGVGQMDSRTRSRTVLCSRSESAARTGCGYPASCVTKSCRPPPRKDPRSTAP